MKKGNKILLLGGSAGGFGVILNLLKSIPKNFPIPIVVIVHRNPKFESNFEYVLKNTFAIHLSNEVWRHQFLDKNKTFHKWSKYEMLKRKYLK